MFIQMLLEDPQLYAMIVGVVIVSVCLHECAHAVMAFSQGDATAKQAGFLTLNPWVQMGPQSLLFLFLAGIAWGETPIKTENFKYGRLSETLVALAGPAMNLCLMLLSIGIWVSLGERVLFQPTLPSMLLKVSAQLNAVLFLLNLIPLPPLDGFAILSPWVPLLRKNATVLSQYGFVLLILLFFVFHGGSYLFDLASRLQHWVYTWFSLLLR